jgi:y4mF family transcriptional regulator
MVKKAERSIRNAAMGRSLPLAEQVRARRRALKLTQQALAELAGCTARFVRSVEAGKSTVRLDKFLALLTALGLEFDVRPRKPA